MCGFLCFISDFNSSNNFVYSVNSFGQAQFPSTARGILIIFITLLSFYVHYSFFDFVTLRICFVHTFECMCMINNISRFCWGFLIKLNISSHLIRLSFHLYEKFVKTVGESWQLPIVRVVLLMCFFLSTATVLSILHKHIMTCSARTLSRNNFGFGISHDGIFPVLIRALVLALFAFELLVIHYALCFVLLMVCAMFNPETWEIASIASIIVIILLVRKQRKIHNIVRHECICLFVSLPFVYTHKKAPCINTNKAKRNGIQTKKNA